MKKKTLLLLIFILILAGCGYQTTSDSTATQIPNSISNNETEVIVQDSVQTDTPASEPTTIVVQNTEPTSESIESISFKIVDTGQTSCYENENSTACSAIDGDFYGQDAQYEGNSPDYTDNGDGTITDNVTGLMWQQDPGDKMTFDQASDGADSFELAGYDDWRLPTIKELYSLILFSGLDPSGPDVSDSSGLTPFIDDIFMFEYGNPQDGDRIIDSQFATSTKYVSTTMKGDETMFGVNFADGRIKGYGLSLHNKEKTFFTLYVRGNPDYGVNDFIDNNDGTISDNATGLLWTQSNSSEGMNWSEALSYCETLDYSGIDEWRLPDAKELQSIVDYTRSPDTTQSAAIDPMFYTTSIINEAGQVDYPVFWSSTTHANVIKGANAAYVSFGRAMGNMNGTWMDVHGAGAQRSDPKAGSADRWPNGHGPQGDAIRIDNFARCVYSGGN